MSLFAVMGALFSALAGIAAWLFRQGGSWNPPQAPTSPVEPRSTPPSAPSTFTENPSAEGRIRPRLSDLLREMRDFEGKLINDHGVPDPNWRNNNPLNYRFYDPDKTGTDQAYLPKYRPVRRSTAGFAVFKDYSTGWTYAFEDKRQKIKKHPTWTLLDLITNHAPEEDGNDPVHYTAIVARQLGVDSTFPVKDLVIA